jgi:hypothetical protein
MSDWKLDRKSAYVPDVIPNSDPAMYRKAGFGHPIGSGRKVGIAVVDMPPLHRGPVTGRFRDDRLWPIGLGSDAPSLP